MTFHAAKGLEFDIVVLPELDASLQGRTPALVVGRDKKTLDATFVSRYAAENLRALMVDEDQAVFVEEQQRRVEESLCLLYVAITRAIHALHMFIPGPRQRRSRKTRGTNSFSNRSIRATRGLTHETLRSR